MRTRSLYNRHNWALRDEDYSPARGLSLWESCPILPSEQDPAVAFTFFDEFQDWKLAGTDIGWARTATGAGTSVIGDAAGGVLVNTCSTSDNDMIQAQWNSEGFALATGKPCWFEARLKINETIQSDMFVGLIVTDTSIVVSAPSDGVWFRKDDGDTNFDFVTSASSTATATTAVGTAVDDTYVKLGFFYDGAGSVFGYINGVLVATHTANIPTTELAPSFAIQQGEGTNAKILSIDYIKAVQIR